MDMVPSVDQVGVGSEPMLFDVSLSFDPSAASDQESRVGDQTLTVYSPGLAIGTPLARAGKSLAVNTREAGVGASAGRALEARSKKAPSVATARTEDFMVVASGVGGASHS